MSDKITRCLPHMKRPAVLCLLSALLVFLSFPRADFWFCAWVALVPLFLVLERCTPSKAFGWGYLTGLLIFGSTLYWFIHVTVPGAILLVLYLSFYIGLFAFSYAVLSHHGVYFRLWVVPALWVVFEYLRGHLLTGFGWVFLAHSQTANLPLIQIADITGVYGVSFVVVMVNMALAQYLEYRCYHRINIRSKLPGLAVVTAAVLAVSLGYGVWRLNTLPPAVDHVRVGVVQGNIAQDDKWDPQRWAGIMRQYIRLTSRVAASKPDIIIWPETSFPGYIWENPDRFEDLKTFVRQLNIPLLLGTVTMLREEYYNSALLVDTRGVVSHQYDKLHLVPYGEYIPFRGVLPFLDELIGIGDFSPGRVYTLFPLKKSTGRWSKTAGYFSTLICFEDTVPGLARQFVQKGSQMLVNITNDAWFKDTIAPFLHLKAALFRAVENRRALVRVANTGVSAFIDPAGRVLDTVNDAGRLSYIEGVAVQNMGLYNTASGYTMFGDVFIFVCSVIVVSGIIRKNQ